MNQPRSAKEVLERHRESIMRLPGVIGIAIARCTGDPERTCILVYSTNKDWPKGLPKALDGIEIELETRSKGFRPL